MRKNYEEISLQSDVFEAARKDFDRLLQKLFRTMENNESKEGSITLKVNVQTEKTPARDEHGAIDADFREIPDDDDYEYEE